MNEHTIYRALSLFNTAKAVRKGPKATAKRAARIAAYRGLSKALRKAGL